MQESRTLAVARFAAAALFFMSCGTVEMLFAERRKSKEQEKLIVQQKREEREQKKEAIIKGLRERAAQIYGYNLPFVIYVNSKKFYADTSLVNQLSDLFVEANDFMEEFSGIRDMKEQTKTGVKKTKEKIGSTSDWEEETQSSGILGLRAPLKGPFSYVQSQVMHLSTRNLSTGHDGFFNTIIPSSFLVGPFLYDYFPEDLVAAELANPFKRSRAELKHMIKEAGIRSEKSKERLNALRNILKFGDPTVGVGGGLLVGKALSMSEAEKDVSDVLKALIEQCILITERTAQAWEYAKCLAENVSVSDGELSEVCPNVGNVRFEFHPNLNK